MPSFVRIDVPAGDHGRQQLAAMINAELRAEVAAGRRRMVMTLWALLSLPTLYFAMHPERPTARKFIIATWGIAGLLTALCWLLEIRWRQRADQLADAASDQLP